MTKPSAPITERRYVVPLILVTSLFFLWAFGVNLNDILIPHLKKAFRLSDFRSSWIQVAFFGGYFLAALPAGWLMEKIGYKRGILVGLLTCATGALLFIPAASVRLYFFSCSPSSSWLAAREFWKSQRIPTSPSSVRPRVPSVA